MRAVAGAIRVQFEITRHNVMDYYWMLLIPFFALIFMAVLEQSGRSDLLAYALVGPLLVGIGQMGFYVASEVVSRDRETQTLELEVATPAPLALVIASRTLLLTSAGLLGFAESWLVAYVVFGETIHVYHLDVLVITLVATTFAAGATAVVTSALFSLTRSARSMQNTITYPLYVLSGVLVPVTFLPDWIEPVSRFVFLFWAADLLRDSLSDGQVADWQPRVAAILALGSMALVVGSLILDRMVDHLRQEGRLGL
jgi:ABC-2 type transport system permease protein